MDINFHSPETWFRVQLHYIIQTSHDSRAMYQWHFISHSHDSHLEPGMREAPGKVHDSLTIDNEFYWHLFNDNVET